MRYVLAYYAFLALGSLLTLALLGGCAAPAPIIIACPPVFPWTQAQESQLADELEPVSEAAMVWRMHDEWAELRAKLEACHADH